MAAKRRLRKEKLLRESNCLIKGHSLAALGGGKAPGKKTTSFSIKKSPASFETGL